MCFAWIWEQTAIISLYSINWLVFITETECVYCAVRTGSLYTASLTFSSSTFRPHSVFMCFVWIWEQTAIISLYSINWLIFITETECVYCAVRTGSLSIIRVSVRVHVTYEMESNLNGRCLNKFKFPPHPPSSIHAPSIRNLNHLMRFNKSVAHNALQYIKEVFPAVVWQMQIHFGKSHGLFVSEQQQTVCVMACVLKAWSGGVCVARHSW